MKMEKQLGKQQKKRKGIAKVEHVLAKANALIKSAVQAKAKHEDEDQKQKLI